MDLSSLPVCCLFDAVAGLPPAQVALLARGSGDMARLCASQCLWKEMYFRKFPRSSFRVLQSHDNVDWFSLFTKRSAIMDNIRARKPRVRSFAHDGIVRIRALSNAFAYNTQRGIFLTAYEYDESECLYEEVAGFDVDNNDFVFLDERTILSVGENRMDLIDLETSKQDRIDIKTAERPNIQPISSSTLAIVDNKDCIIYDIRDKCEPKCKFEHDSNVIEMVNQGSLLFMASDRDLMCHDIRNPRGPTLWDYTSPQICSFCSFNQKEQYALFGNNVINMLTGKLKYLIDVPDPVCGSLHNDSIAIIGCKKKSIKYFDYIQKKEITEFQFPMNECINSLYSSSLNGYVAVAGDYNIKILSVPTPDAPNAEQVRNVLCGSVAQRKRGDIGKIKQVLFDGERLITNNESFIRVYDFYSGQLHND